MTNGIAGLGAAEARELARRHRGPAVRPASRPGWFEVTFVFSDRRRRIRTAGLVCPALPRGIAEMAPLGDATFVLTVELPGGTRVPYHFCPDLPPAGERDDFALVHSPRQRRIDYANPRYDQITVPSLRLRLLESLLCLPGAALPPPRRQVARHGAVEVLELPGGSRTAVVYRPAAPAPPAGYPLLVLLAAADEWEPAEATFDRLHDDDRIEPFAGLWLGGGSYTARMRDLGGAGANLVRDLRDRILPAVQERVPVDPGRRVTAGFSAGAVGALRVALDDPGAYAGCLLLSGAFHLDHRMEAVNGHRGAGDRWWAGRTHGPRAVYLAAGRYEDRFEPPADETARQVAAELGGLGARIRVVIGPTGHDTVSAAEHLRAGLTWALRAV